MNAAPLNAAPPNLGSPVTWYHATAAPLAPFPPLDGDREAETIVVGGGYTGLGAALTLALAGREVVLIDAERLGLGASGRNGGQIHRGQRRDQRFLEGMFGPETARRLWNMAEASITHLEGLIARHAIACDRVGGLILADHKASFVAESHAYAEHLARVYGDTRIEPLDRAALQALVRSDDYHGGLIDRGAGHLHPLKLLQGMALAAARAGARIHEGTRALAIEARGAGHVVVTPQGRIAARSVILAGDILMEGLAPDADARMLPIASTVAVTEPLGERLNALLSSDAAVSDSRFVVNYFRPTPDGRLLFGGGESYSTKPVPDPGRLVRKALAQVFPSLAGVRFDHAWSGLVGITRHRLPLVRSPREGLWLAAGYSGHGLALAPYVGHLIARVLLPQSDGEAAALLKLLGQLPSPAFPGGTWLRRPLLAAAMSYHALRDRF